MWKLLILASLLLISVQTVSAQNLNFTNVTDDGESFKIDETVTFTGYWSSFGSTRLLVADTTGFSNCDFTTQTGCMCFSASTTSNTSTCSYKVKKTDPGNFTWFGRMCTSSECTDVVKEYNFSGITNPSSTHIAYEGDSALKPPTSLHTGTELPTANYTNISASDDARAVYSTAGGLVYEYQRFAFLIDVPANSINFINVTHEGYGTANCGINGLELYLWDSSGSWSFQDIHLSATSDDIVQKEMYQGYNYSEFLNETDNYINSLVIVRNTRTGSCGTVYTDQAKVVLHVGGYFLLSITNYQVTLTLNNSDPNVYVPAASVGETQASQLGTGTKYTSPDSFYLASYLGNVLTGLVTSFGEYIFVSNTSSSHTLKISQNVTPHRSIFLTLTQGDYRDIDKRMGIIKTADFLTNVKPTFGYGLGSLYPIKIIRNYTEIDIRGNSILQKGKREIVIDYNDTTSDNKPALFIK